MHLIYANHANLCESFEIEYIRISILFDLFKLNIFELNLIDRNMLFHICINSHRSNIFNLFNLFDRNMRFNMRIYSLCKYMRICRIYRMHAYLLVKLIQNNLCVLSRRTNSKQLRQQKWHCIFSAPYNLASILQTLEDSFYEHFPHLIRRLLKWRTCS